MITLYIIMLILYHDSANTSTPPLDLFYNNRRTSPTVRTSISASNKRKPTV